MDNKIVRPQHSAQSFRRGYVAADDFGASGGQKRSFFLGADQTPHPLPARKQIIDKMSPYEPA